MGMEGAGRKITNKKNFTKKPQKILTQLVITSYEELNRCSEKWNELCDDSGAFIQSRPEWVLGWWKEFGGGPYRKLQVITYWSSGVLVGVAPFYVGLSVVRGSILQRRLRLIGSGGATNEVFGFSDDYGVSDFLDIVMRPGYEQLVSQELLSWLNSHQSYFDYIQFLHTREDQSIFSSCWPLLQSSPFETHQYVSDHCPYIDLKGVGSIRGYIDSLPSKSARRRLRQSRDASIHKGNYVARRVRSLSELRDAFQDLIKLHQQRWNRAGFPGIFDDDRFTRFSRPLIENLFQKNKIRAYLALDPETGQRIAVRIALSDGLRYYDYLTGFDDEHPLSRHRPGIGLMTLMIEDAIADQVQTIELLRGEEPYKFDFTSHIRENYYLEIRTVRAEEHRIQNQLVNHVSRLEKAFRRERKLIRTQTRENGYRGVYLYGKHRLASVNRRVQSRRNHQEASFDSIPVLALSEIGLVHSLGKASIPVISGSFFHDNPALDSAYTRGKVMFSPYDTTEFIDELIEFGKQSSGQIALMSDDDRAILNISRHRHLLEPYYLFRLPRPDLVDRISNKQSFIGVCKEYNLPAPQSFSVESESDLETILPELSYPVILKPPYKEYWWGESFERLVGPYKKAFRAENEHELRRLYSRIVQVHPSVLIQEYISGSDQNHISVNLFVDVQHDVKALFAARKHRVYPVTAGVGSFVQLMTDERLDDLCGQIVQKLNLTGLVNIQFKEDDRTGEYRLIEIQFRNSYWGYIGTAAGINLPSMYYSDLLGRALPEFPETIQPVKFFDVGKDIKAALDYFKNGELTFAQWVQSYQGPKTFHGFQLSDPVPVFRHIGYLTSRRVKKFLKKDTSAL